MIISHIKSVISELPEWRIQSDEEHNSGVAELASHFASEFGFDQWGRILGLLHDKGKEQDGFQKYIQGVTGYKPELASSNRTPHAYIGALIARKLYPQAYPMLSYPIMGHHTGLFDYDKFENTMQGTIPEDVKIEPLKIVPDIPSNFKIQKEDFHHLLRMLYSCLVDADFLDTEGFMDEGNALARNNKQSIGQLLPKLELFLARLNKEASDTLVNRIRAEIQDECVKTAEVVPGFFSLTVPTGGGKTLSSLVWAMRHAVKYEKRRIIIAIPYTSIIVQTAQVLRDIFGEENVLEHHSNVDPDKVRNKELALKIKLATENWDYPIIVTTNVQLFESMFSNRPSTCRKLHNIANSVLILDEVQTLPLEYLQPIVDSLKTFQRLFGTSVLFTTASQPALKGDICLSDDSKKSFFHGISDIKEIIPVTFKLHEKLHRVNLHFDEVVSTYDEIAERMIGYDRILCIVNTRKDAQEIYTRLPKEGLTLHLSRMMCAKHISETIEKIKTALRSDVQLVIRVVSTQLIEAGVDIDFPMVFRQEAGLDSILQAAGRCNREGKLGISDVYVFRLNKALPMGYISKASDAQKSLSKESDWFNPETMIAYFIQLYSRTPTFDKADIGTYLYKPLDFCFETAAQKFRLIDDNSKSIVVNFEDSTRLIEQLEREGPGYGLMKRLSQYTVNVRERDFKELLKMGLIEEVMSGIFFLPGREQYDDKVGLITENHWLEEILIK